MSNQNRCRCSYYRPSEDPDVCSICGGHYQVDEPDHWCDVCDREQR